MAVKLPPIPGAHDFTDEEYAILKRLLTDDIPEPLLSMDPEGTPLDTQPYQPELTPLDSPPYVEPKDKTPKIHFGTGTGGGPRDQLTELTLGQEVDLLAKNNVFMSKRQLSDSNGLGSMKAYVVGSSSLSPAREIAVRVKKVRLEHPPTARKQKRLIPTARSNPTCRSSW